jgi:hypothetical protein
MKIFDFFKKKDSSNNQSDNIEEIKKVTPKNDQPEFIIVMGGVCTGKTTLRNNKYATGYVNVDAGEIFIELSKGEYFDFPSHLEDKMNQIGITKMRESIKEKKNIVIEIIGANYETVKELIALSEKINYTNNVDYLECDMEAAWQRNVHRSNDNISAHFCEPYHVVWFKQAAIEHLNPNYAKKTKSSCDYDDNIYDEDIEDYAFGRGNLSPRKINLIENTLGKNKNADNIE